MNNEEILVFIEHILENIKKIESFSDNISREELSNNDLIQYAIIRATEIIGEAVANLSRFFRDKHPEIPWKEIVGTRDKLIHHYFGVNLDIIWDVIKKDLPDLKQKILKIKADLEEQEKEQKRKK